MKVKSFVVLVFLVAFAGIACAQQEGAPSVDQRFTTANEWLNKNNLSVTNTPEQAFVNDYVLVSGEGLPSQSSKSPAQRRLTAIRAAETLAYRRLTEFLEGFAVVGDTLVKDAELQYDVVRTSVSGFVKGAQSVYQEYNEQEGSAIVIVKIGMTGPRGFGHTLYEKLLGDPKIRRGIVENERAPEYRHRPIHLDENYDGLIIDATDQSFRPALINRIFTAKGDIMYDPSKVSQKVLVEQGCGEYTNSAEKAKAALATRGVNNPLVVRAVGTVSASDLKVSDDDAVRIYSANQRSNFFASAKVAFVLK